MLAVQEGRRRGAILDMGCEKRSKVWGLSPAVGMAAAEGCLARRCPFAVNSLLRVRPRHSLRFSEGPPPSCSQGFSRGSPVPPGNQLASLSPGSLGGGGRRACHSACRQSSCHSWEGAALAEQSLAVGAKDDDVVGGCCCPLLLWERRTGWGRDQEDFMMRRASSQEGEPAAWWLEGMGRQGMMANPTFLGPHKWPTPPLKTTVPRPSGPEDLPHKLSGDMS